MTKLTKITLILLLVLAAVLIGISTKTNETPSTEASSAADTCPNLDECMTQGDINRCLSSQERKYQDSVDAVFNQFLTRCSNPEQYRKEQVMWHAYYEAGTEAYRRLYMGGFCGSAAPMGMASYLKELDEQWLLSFDASPTRHMTITDQMVQRQYDHFLANIKKAHEDNNEIDNDDYPLQEKLNYLKAERSAWEQWIRLRSQNAAQLKGKERAAYDNCTNNLRRHKLIQLKNQYEWGQLNSDDYFELLLDPSCSDHELMEYESIAVALDKYTKSLYDSH